MRSCRRRPSPSQLWLARRAASELAVDPDLRFFDFRTRSCRTQAREGLPGGVGLSTAMSEIKRLLDPDQGEQADPLLEKLKAIAGRGRAGAVVTKLQIAPDMSNVTVESTLWVRAGERWMPFGSRAATVRPEDLGAEAGKGLEADPQIQGAFKVVESLGLGAIPEELKTRSLRIGAATETGAGDGSVCIQRRSSIAGTSGARARQTHHCTAVIFSECPGRRSSRDNAGARGIGLDRLVPGRLAWSGFASSLHSTRDSRWPDGSSRSQPRLPETR